MKKLILSAIILCMSTGTIFAKTYDEAKIAGKPIVVMFHMPGCSACNQLEPLFDKIEKKNSEKFSFAKEDIYKSKIMKKFNFDTVPQVYIIEPKTEQTVLIGQECAFDKKCFEKTLIEYK